MPPAKRPYPTIGTNEAGSSGSAAAAGASSSAAPAKRVRGTRTSPVFSPAQQKTMTAAAVAASKNAPRRSRAKTSNPNSPARIESFVSPHVRRFVKGAEKLEDWRPRCQYFWSFMFFLRWDYSPSEREALMEHVMPLGLRPQARALTLDFEKVYDDIALWFRERVAELGLRFLTSLTGGLWIKACRKARVQRKRAPELDLTVPEGLGFSRLDLIKVFARTLPVMHTEKKVAPGSVGWLVDPQDPEEGGLWAELLQRQFLKVVEGYIRGESRADSSHSEQAITRDLLKFSPFHTDTDLQFPPVKSNDRLDMKLLAQDPYPVPMADDGTTTAQMPMRSKTFSDLGSRVRKPLDELPEPEAPGTEQLAAIGKRAAEKEKELQEGLLIALREESDGVNYVEGQAAPAPPLLPLNLVSSISLPPTDYDSCYATELSDSYARSNLWGKTEIHLQLLDQERRRLDTLNFQIHSRIEQIKEETAMVKNRVASLQQKHDVLRSLYSQHAEHLSALDEATATAQEIDHSIDSEAGFGSARGQPTKERPLLPRPRTLPRNRDRVNSLWGPKTVQYGLYNRSDPAASTPAALDPDYTPNDTRSPPHASSPAPPPRMPQIFDSVVIKKNSPSVSRDAHTPSGAATAAPASQPFPRPDNRTSAPRDGGEGGL